MALVKESASPSPNKEQEGSEEELTLSKFNTSMTRQDLNQTMTSLKLKAKDQFDKTFNGNTSFKLKSLIKN